MRLVTGPHFFYTISMWKRKKLHEVSLDTDIRYRGILSEREFRILGWICLAIVQVTILMRAGIRMNPALEERFAVPSNILSYFASMALPLLLIANFSAILNSPRESSGQLIRSLIMLVLFGGLFLLVFYHYGVGLVAIFTQSRAEALKTIRDGLTDDGGRKFISFNIFVDFFLCSLFTFFLFYRPERPFKKWALILFRLATVLPVAYELLMLYLKYLAYSSIIVIPIWVYPILPVKPPMTFILFILLALFVKTREYRFCRHGRPYEEYLLFLKTNRNSLQFSIFASITSLIAGFVDFYIFIVYTFAEMVAKGVDIDQLDSFKPMIIRLGFGSSTGLIFLAPLLMLYSYNRKNSNRTVMALIPVAGIVLIILVYLQGTYQLLNQIPAFVASHMAKL